MLIGFDVSRFNAVLTREQLDAHDARFLIARASDGDDSDPRFLAHLDSAEHLHRGAYHRFAEGVDVDAQIKTYLRQLDEACGSDHLLLAVDLESAKGGLYKDPSSVLVALETFVAALPRTPLIYSFPYLLWQLLAAGPTKLRTIVERCPRLWIAHPGATRPAIPPGTWPGHALWQTGTRRIGGRKVDVNVFDGDAAELAELWGCAP